MEIFIIIALIVIFFMLRGITSDLGNIENSLSDLNDKLNPPNTHHDDY